MRPETRDLAVPAFVGGERGIPEWHARQHGKRYRDERDEWGPPREHLDRRTALLAGVGLIAALAIAVADTGLALTPDRYLLVLLVPALILRRGRRYLLDFVPFAVLLVLYAQCRGIAHLLRPHPFYTPQLHAEKFLFGSLPTEQLQLWLWKGSPSWYDRAVVDVMKLHFIVPPLLAFILWFKRRALFYRFAATILTLSFAGALTFLLFPAAPPWAAADRGLLPMITKLPVPKPKAFSSHGFSVTDLIHPNPYAAIPSLHAGYAFLAFLFVVTLAWKTRWRWLALLGLAYPLAQCFAVVYTANHYVVDLVIGCAYAAVSLWGVQRLWRRWGWPE
jgi:hypothetical protein